MSQREEAASPRGHRIIVGERATRLHRATVSIAATRHLPPIPVIPDLIRGDDPMRGPMRGPMRRCRSAPRAGPLAGIDVHILQRAGPASTPPAASSANGKPPPATGLTGVPCPAPAPL